jgi:hypothetical protein
MEKDFEAHGRYHSALERLDINTQLRERLLKELKEYVDKATSKSVGNSPYLNLTNFLSKTDLDKMVSLINQIAEANQNMISASEEVDKYSGQCEPPEPSLKEPSLKLPNFDALD